MKEFTTLANAVNSFIIIDGTLHKASILNCYDARLKEETSKPKKTMKKLNR